MDNRFLSVEFRVYLGKIMEMEGFDETERDEHPSNRQ